MTHEFDLLWDFHGVQEKAMKYIQIFYGVQIHGNLMGTLNKKNKNIYVSMSKH